MAHWHGGGFTGSTREEDVLGKAYDARLMKRLLGYVWPLKRYLAIALVFVALSTACRLALPYLFKVAQKDVFSKSAQALGDWARFAKLDRIVLVGVLVLLGLFFFTMGRIVITNLLGQKIMHRLRTQIFNHLQSLSLSYFDDNPAGRLVTRTTSDVLALNELFTSGIITLVSDVFVIVGIVIILSLHSVKMTLVAMLIIPPLFVGAYFFRRKARVVFRNIRMKIARVNAFVAETVAGIRIIQIFTQEGRSASRFEEVNNDYRKENIQAVRYTSVYFPFVEVMSGFASILVIWFAAYLISGQSLTDDEFILFWFYVGMFFHPIIELSGMYSILQSAMASSERIFNLLDTKPGIVNAAQPSALSAVKGKIEFRHVWFSYRPEPEPAPSTYVLKDISFTVKPGESVALVGATGAGKTSIISLLARLYDVKRGSILVDGTDIRTLDKHDLRRRVGTVMQDVFLFSGDIRRNITLGEETITDSQLQDACTLVNADRFIERLPAGFDSPVAERGVTFSAGERQLLSFARAVVREPAIIVLDEATSSVDTETERIIQQGLFRLMEGRTSIIVAHRLSTIKHVDRIIVLHHGEIREVGSHQELLAHDGIYRKLYELQYKSQENGAGASSSL